MTDEEMRITIAEACGWRTISVDASTDKLGLIGIDPAIRDWGIIPDYRNDLNAMHAAESTLTDEQRIKFGYLLCEIALSTPDDPPNFDLSELSPKCWIGIVELSIVISATARQRAEAFIKTIQNK